MAIKSLPPVKKNGEAVSTEQVRAIIHEPELVEFEYVVNGEKFEFAMLVNRLGVRADASVEYDTLKAQVAASALGGKKAKVKSQTAEEKLADRYAGRAAYEEQIKNGTAPDVASQAKAKEGYENEDSEELSVEQMLALTDSMPKVYEAQVRLLVPAIQEWNVPELEPSIATFMSAGGLATSALKALVKWNDPTPNVSAEEGETTPIPSSTNTSSTSSQMDGAENQSQD